MRLIAYFEITIGEPMGPADDNNAAHPGAAALGGAHEPPLPDQCVAIGFATKSFDLR